MHYLSLYLKAYEYVIYENKRRDRMGKIDRRSNERGRKEVEDRQGERESGRYLENKKRRNEEDGEKEEVWGRYKERENRKKKGWWRENETPGDRKKRRRKRMKRKRPRDWLRMRKIERRSILEIEKRGNKGGRARRDRPTEWECWKQRKENEEDS
jgi:hypothetical protein